MQDAGSPEQEDRCWVGTALLGLPPLWLLGFAGGPWKAGTGGVTNACLEPAQHRWVVQRQPWTKS